MSDFPDNGSLRPWLETELARQLGPVRAPDFLWTGISRPAPRPRWVLWPVITVALLVASCVLVWQIGRARAAINGIDQLSSAELQALAGEARGIGIESADPVEIRRWLKATGNINVDLAFGARPPIRLLGARLIPTSGGPIATIAFRAGEETGTLVISRSMSIFGGRSTGLANTKHAFSRIEPKLVSWSMKRQEYAIAFTGADPAAACRLCHTDGRMLTILN